MKCVICRLRKMKFIEKGSLLRAFQMPEIPNPGGYTRYRSLRLLLFKRAVTIGVNRIVYLVQKY